MFRVILFSQWKWTRLIVVLGAVAGFALPVLSVQGVSSDVSSALRPGELLAAMQSWGVLYPVLAAAMSWEPLVDTSEPSGRVTHTVLYSPGQVYRLQGQSFALFINRAPRPAGNFTAGHNAALGTHDAPAP